MAYLRQQSDETFKHAENVIEFVTTFNDNCNTDGKKMLTVWDNKTSHKLLVDSGVEVSCIPAFAPDHSLRSSTAPFIAGNCFYISTWGNRNHSVKLGKHCL